MLQNCVHLVYFFHKSTIFLFVLCTNKGKSAKINDFFWYFYHQNVLIALKLFFNLINIIR